MTLRNENDVKTYITNNNQELTDADREDLVDLMYAFKFIFLSQKHPSAKHAEPLRLNLKSLHIKEVFTECL